VELSQPPLSQPPLSQPPLSQKKLSQQQASSLVALGLRHVCKVPGVSRADVAAIALRLGARPTPAATIEAIIDHASRRNVIDIARATWRPQLGRLFSAARALDDVAEG
jgi:hypothetical protein